ncbi:MAG: Smr/MutS family protein, partial [Nitrospinota bacterium]
SVVERAGALRERGSVEMEEVMARVARDEADLRARREGLEREQERVAELRRKAEEEASRLAEERATLARRLRAESRRFLDRARERVERMLEELPARPLEGARGEARRVLGELESERLAAFAPAPRPDDEPASARAGERALRVGDWVHVLPLGREGRVLALGGDGSLTVEAGGKTLRVGPGAVRRAEGACEGHAPRAGATGHGERAGSVEPPLPAEVQENGEFRSGAVAGVSWDSPEGPFEGDLHLLGVRVEDALSRVDKYLNHAALLGLRSVRIVHGKGTGALREAVGAALQGHPLVRDFRPEALERGGWGVTVVELRG